MHDLAHAIKHVGGPLSEAECHKLAALAAATTASKALEVGHYLGRSTSVLLTSLPPDVELVTIDHHGGDDWCPATAFDRFLENVDPYVGDRTFTAINQDMRVALPGLPDRYGFVFYDADHREQAVRDFWALTPDLLEPECVLSFDDADWEEQSVLRTLAEADGFEVVTDTPFWRGWNDKDHADTYTLEVMVRRA